MRLLAYFDTKSRKYLTSRAERKLLVLVSDKGSGKKKKSKQQELSNRQKSTKYMGKKSESAILQMFHDVFFIFSIDFLQNRMIIKSED